MHRIDASDEATGLPPMLPMGDDSEPAAIVLKGESGGTSVMTVPGTDVTKAVRIIHLRGVLVPQDGDDPDAEPCWIQRPLAIPVELVPAVIAALKPQGLSV